MSQAEELLASLTEEVPVHSHKVDAADVYLVIDPVSRKIEDSVTKKIVIMQHDHESKRFRFEIPRYISGHDMSLCNRVYVHWNNIHIEDETVEENADLHEVTDLRIDPDNEEKVICSWLVKRNSTQLVGILSFLIQYMCVDDDGNSTYEFHSDFYEDVEIREGRKNSEAAIIEYTDILEQWYARLFGAGKSAVNDISEALATAKQTLQEESATQQAAIEDAGLKALNSIPPEYAEVYRMSEESMRSKADAIVLQAEGNPISVSNASNDPLQSLRIFGKTEQAKTNGYQLFDASKISSKKEGGVTLTNNGDGSLTISGSGAMTEYFSATHSIMHDELVKLLKVGSLHLVTGRTRPYFVAYILDSETNKRYVTMLHTSPDCEITQEMLDNEKVIMMFSFYGSPGEEIIPGTIKPMLYQDGDGTWEPYSGGYASPSPDWPQELESIEAPSVIVRGKNLLPETSVEFTRDLYLPLGFKYPTGKYTFSAVLTSTDTDDVKSAVLFYDGEEWINSMFVPRSENGERVSYSLTLDREFDTIRFYSSRSYNTSEGDMCTITDMQLELNNVPTEFEPYSGHILPTQRTLNAIGDVKDELVYNYQTDTWKYVQRVMGRTLVGNENFEDYIASDDAVTLYVPHKNDCPLYSSHALNHVEINWANSSRIQFKASKFGINTVPEFAEFVTEQYENGSPIKLLYILATPIIHELTTEEVLVFKALRTNKPNTVIQNGVGAHMAVEYGADTKKYVDETATRIIDEVTGAVYTLKVRDGEMVLEPVA